ncbi:Organic cation/carnitine transporter 7 [Sesamum angolense]|uniref:Organic cation/carnitine transporter 7 n=1 Tax=Sesamum angolense TaxID=2727404 RepID=A0AAE1WNY3_9LAMI|nr:Organic cation/carnitine transporter 7 [Sesamum angolense]
MEPKYNYCSSVQLTLFPANVNGRSIQMQHLFVTESHMLLDFAVWGGMVDGFLEKMSIFCYGSLSRRGTYSIDSTNPMVRIAISLVLLRVRMGDSDTVYTLDEALTTVGFGKYQGLLLAYGGLGWVAEAMEMMILSFVGSAVQSEWHLSSGQKSLISTVVFAGMLVGAYFWGVISDNYGRKKGFLGVASITAVAGLLSAVSPNYKSLLLLRCITGVGLGGMHIYTSWFLEFVPTPSRGAWMIVFSTFWTVGTIFEAGLAWIIMPSFGWRWLVALSSGPSFIVLLLYCLAPESPRFLCMKGRTNEAYNILRKAALLNGTALPAGKLVSDQEQDQINESTASESTHLLSPRVDEPYKYKANSSSLFILFSSKLIRTNLLLWFLYFGNTFAYYGVILLTSELSSDQSKCNSIKLHSEKSQNASLYIDVFITSLAGSWPDLIRLHRGQNGSEVFHGNHVCVSFIATSSTGGPSERDFNHNFIVWSSYIRVSNFFVACIYCPEVYPTNIRATGVGIATAIGRIGGMICPLVAVGLVNDCQQAYAVILFQVMIILSALSVLLSPFETNGRHLADTLTADDRDRRVANMFGNGDVMTTDQTSCEELVAFPSCRPRLYFWRQ